MNRRMGAVERELRLLQGDLRGLTDTVTAMQHAVPAFAVSAIPESVFPANSPTHAAVHGDLATWSLVTCQGRNFAVSAANCALALGGSKDVTFVPLPKSVLQHGVKTVFFAAPPTEFAATVIPCRHDFVAVELERAPPADTITAAEWPTHVPQNVDGCSVVGRTNTITVSGKNAARMTMRFGADAAAGPDDFVVFTEVVSEGGSSGALLYMVGAIGAGPVFQGSTGFTIVMHNYSDC
jgi:hypothetical protein